VKSVFEVTVPSFWVCELSVRAQPPG
jgi:hypothetical protein